jgi:hypothetical protein
MRCYLPLTQVIDLAEEGDIQGARPTASVASGSYPCIPNVVLPSILMTFIEINVDTRDQM